MYDKLQSYLTCKIMVQSVYILNILTGQYLLEAFVTVARAVFMLYLYFGMAEKHVLLLEIFLSPIAQDARKGEIVLILLVVWCLTSECKHV